MYVDERAAGSDSIGGYKTQHALPCYHLPCSMSIVGAILQDFPCIARSSQVSLAAKNRKIGMGPMQRLSCQRPAPQLRLPLLYVGEIGPNRDTCPGSDEPARAQSGLDKWVWHTPAPDGIIQDTLLEQSWFAQEAEAHKQIRPRQNSFSRALAECIS